MRFGFSIRIRGHCFHCLGIYLKGKGLYLKRTNVRFVARNFKRQSERKLSKKDLLILEFLWNWKVASTPMLKEVAYKTDSPWWVYRALRRLKQEKYIQLLPSGQHVDQELWALTKNGFEVVLMDRGDMDQYRYRVHAPAHDYLGTCLQLGELWQSNADARFFTEQQLSSLSKWNFPRDLRVIEEHIPDGVTYIRGQIHTAIIGYEVDINLKDEERYANTVRYYREGLKPHLVVWLVRNVWMAEKIWGCIKDRHYVYDGEDLGKLYVFILLDDFKKNVWGAKVINGSLKGLSLRKLHANLIQTAGKDGANLSQKPMAEIFFPKFKSPQKSIGSVKPASSDSALTPYGSRGENNLSIQPTPAASLSAPSSAQVPSPTADTNPNPTSGGVNE